MKTAIKVGSREGFFQSAKERLIKLESGERIDSTRQIVFEDASPSLPPKVKKQQ